MYSIAILPIVLFALFATTNALECRPVTCMLACPFGFDLDAQGCPYCKCRKSSSTCFEPIFGYNCGTIDHRDCPSSHECQLSLSGLTGQCCLKPTGSTTASPKSTSTRTATGTSTARLSTSTATATPRSSTRRSLNRLFTFATGSTTQAQRSSSTVPTTPNSVTPRRYTRPGSSTQRWITLVLPKWIGGSDE